MAVTQQSIIINDWGNLAATERRRTTSKGTKSRYTLDIRATPLAIRVDPEALGRDVANAIADAVRNGITAITETAKPTTQLARKYALNAWNRGEGWTVRRYAGGRTPAAAPASVSSSRLFNDSGRLARGVFARANTEEIGYTINVTANRLDRDSFGSGFEAMIVRLRDLVPVLSDPATELRKDAGVYKAIRKTAADLVDRADRKFVEAVKQTASFVGKVGDVVGRADEPDKPEKK